MTYCAGFKSKRSGNVCSVKRSLLRAEISPLCVNIRLCLHVFARWQQTHTVVTTDEANRGKPMKTRPTSEVILHFMISKNQSLDTASIYFIIQLSNMKQTWITFSLLHLRSLFGTFSFFFFADVYVWGILILL